jgi:hypothetical protein
MSHRLLASLCTIVAVGAAIPFATMPIAGPMGPGTLVAVAEASGGGTQAPGTQAPGTQAPATQAQTTTRDPEKVKQEERKLIRDVAEGLKKQDAARSLPAEVLKNWKTARTSWGDPDLTGVYTNSDESGIPFERPAEFEGRALEDVTAAELAELQQARQNAIIERAASAQDNPEAHPQLFWWETLNAKSSRAWLVVDPPDGKIPPLTAEARQRAAARAGAQRRSGRGPADAAEDRSLYDRCISRGLPGSMMPAIYGSSYQIVQGPGYVAIVYEMIHETRVISLSPRPHVGKNIRTYMGDPRGHWEGNTLVVETTNFKDQIAYRGANSQTLRLVERFKAIGPNTVEWSVTAVDPATWSRPWTFAMNLTKKDATQRPFEYACHEGNYGLRNILSAARAEEKQAP